MFDIRFDFSHEAKQKSEILPLFGTAPRRVEGDVSHAQLPYLENLVVRDGDVGVFGFPMLQCVLKSEESGSKLDLGGTNALKPSIQESGGGSDERTGEADEQGIPKVHLLILLCVVAIWTWFVVWLTFPSDKAGADEFDKFRAHMALLINRSRLSDGSVNVHWTNYWLSNK